jgi:hypothetical protein
MVKPSTLIPRPSIFLAFLGGAAATVLLSALLYLAPLLGLPLVDMPLALGGILAAEPGLALGVGYLLFFVGGAVASPFFLAGAWPYLPGGGVGFAGGALKGLVWGSGLWLLSGLLLGLAGMVNRLPEPALASPGFFALGFGLVAAVSFLAAHLFYGLVLGLITAMGQDIEPLDTLGWEGYKYGTRPEVIVRPDGDGRERLKT